MSATSTTAAAPARTTTRPADVLRLGALAAIIAVLADLTVLLAGRLGGADMVVTQPGGASQTVGVAPVVLASLIGIVLGTVLLLVLRDRGRRAWTVVAVVGLVLGLATVPAPFSMTAGTGTQLTLAAMHVVTAIVWFLVVRRGARRLA